RREPMKNLFPGYGAALLVLLLARVEAPAETKAEADRRRERVAERRKGVDIICHRGASEHAHENTLEAFRSTFELGGDGNEFDIRTTRDGVLVLFHDDMLDRLLEAYGDVSDYSWRNCKPSASAIPDGSGRTAASRHS